MRQGSNPQKKDFRIEMKSNHRIVMVVFIPELNGYYQSMFEVIKVSIASLVKTIPSTSKLSIVDNGSCKVVQSYLMDLFDKKEIDSLQLLQENIGKIDALIGAARAVREPIITLTDCDILFKSNWVQETIKVFNNFENVASVSPIPIRWNFNYYSYSTQMEILKGKLKLKFEPIKENFEDYNKFLRSINWGDGEIENTNPWPVLSFNGFKAIITSDHQVLTVRRDILFNNSPKEPSFIRVGSQSEENYIDYAIDSSGGLRLSTYYFYAYHMGNMVEDWMNEIHFDKNEDEYPILKLQPELKYISKNDLFFKIKKKIIKKFFKIKKPSNY